MGPQYLSTYRTEGDLMRFAITWTRPDRTVGKANTPDRKSAGDVYRALVAKGVTEVAVWQGCRVITMA